MEDKKCPVLLAAWIAKYGQYDNMGKVNQYTYCGDDCAWFDQDTNGCALLKSK